MKFILIALMFPLGGLEGAILNDAGIGWRDGLFWIIMGITLAVILLAMAIGHRLQK